MRWQSLAKVLCCGPAQVGVQAGVQAGVQTAVARSGKGAVQGAVQACCEAAAYSAVAKSGRGAVLSRVLYRLWLGLLFAAVAKSGKRAAQRAAQAGEVWQRLCRSCRLLAAAGGSCSQNFSKVLHWGRSLAWCCAVEAAVQSGGEVWQRCCAGCCAGCWSERGGAGYGAGLLGAGCFAVLDSAVANSGKGAAVQAAAQSAVARFGKGAVQSAVQAAVQGAVGGTVRRVLCRLLSRVRSHCIAKDYVGHETRLCTAELLEASTLTCDRDEISSGGKHWFQRLGTSSSSNLEHVLRRLGSIGSLVWEPLVPRTGSPWFQDWEALVRTFGNQLFELRKIGKHSFERLGTASS